ncbi:MAG: MBL fold metallo-hydrolase [Bacteroidota bacterium]
MKLHTIDTGLFKLDGGAMFGVVPKSLWNKLNPADDNNMCTWAMRCLLVEEGNRLILIDNGMGDKQDAKFFGHYYLHGDDSLEKSLKAKGFSTDDITDVFLTHLHFDHCGGSIKYNSTKDKFIPAFKNATYWSNDKHWEWAIHPNPREKASFLKENILPIQESGQLKFLKEGDKLLDNFEIEFVFGHTEAMMLPKISYKGHTILYSADLMPSLHHIGMPYVMAYDMRPLQTMTEKKVILENAIENNYILFFEHDPVNEACTLERGERGIKAKETIKISDIS